MNNQILDKKHLTVTYVSVNELKPTTYNPRVWNEKVISDLTKSIKEQGFVVPILANRAKGRENVVISGHFRLKIAKDLGYKTVPVTYVNVPGLEKEKKLNLTINRVSGDWDFELLKNFDVGMLLDTGFNDSDLSHIWDEQLGVEGDEFEIDKEIAKIKTPRTKLGDIIYLGPHVLLCADCTNPENIKKLTQDRIVDVVYCDPIYNLNVDYDKGIGGKSRYGGTINDNKPESEYREFLKKSIQNALIISKPDAHIFYWNDERHIGLVQDLYKELGIENKRVCLWIKNGFSPTPNTAFNKCYEACIYGVRGRPYLSKSVTNLNEIFNKEIGTGNRTLDDILDYFNIWLVKRLPTQNYEHATEKNPELHEKPLRRCSKPGDVILDLFAGAGSTMVACEQLKRRCLMVEVEPLFCDLIVKRYEKLTKRRAKYGR